uniref:Uncharacterized protein n=1 Tax=Glossina austeni TaxID=7395 RepID=A0A1A9V0L4_GLOAU
MVDILAVSNAFAYTHVHTIRHSVFFGNNDDDNGPGASTENEIYLKQKNVCKEGSGYDECGRSLRSFMSASLRQPIWTIKKHGEKTMQVARRDVLENIRRNRFLLRLESQIKNAGDISHNSCLEINPLDDVSRIILKLLRVKYTARTNRVKSTLSGK